MYGSKSDNQDNQEQAGGDIASNSERPEWQILEKVALASTVEQRRARRWGIFFKSLTFAYLFIFAVLLMPAGDSSLGTAAKKHVGLVEISGLIAAEQPANANDIVGALRNAFKAENSTSVIIAINSPGGSPVQSGYVNDEIYRLKALHPEKKVYAVIADVGASGGYYIASAADEIYADKASMVGSIGVIAASFGFTELMEKIGVDRRIYTSGESKSFLDLYSPEKEEDVEYYKGILSVVHKQFIEVVKKGRGDRLLDDPEIFSGLVWTGEQAVAKGLVDGLGSVGYVAREVIGTEDIRDYTLVTSPFDRLGSYFGISIKSALYSMLEPVLQ